MNSSVRAVPRSVQFIRKIMMKMAVMIFTKHAKIYLLQDGIKQALLKFSG